MAVSVNLTSLRLNALAWALLAVAQACAHRISVNSLPPDAKVYSIDSGGARRELIGKTPLSIADVKGKGLYGIEIDQAGYMPHKIMFPLDYSTDVKIRVNLQKLSNDFIRDLPPALFRSGIDRALEELLYLQSSLYTKPDEDIERMISEYNKKYMEVSAYHFLIGTFNLYKSRYAEASKAFTKAIELDPKNEDARKMLVLTDVKFVNQSQAMRSRAFADIEASAKEVASLSNGYVAKVKVNPNSPTYDGFEIVIPSDALFRPTTARVTPRGASILNNLSKEFLKVQQGLSLVIEAHTDSDASTEANDNPGFVTKGKSPFKSTWELSSARAASVMELLKAEGVTAETWSIAGYADSRPLLYKPAGKKPEINQTFNRRIVLRVSILPRERNETVMSEEELRILKNRASQFLDQGDGGSDQNRSGRRSRSNNDSAIGNGTNSSNGSRNFNRFNGSTRDGDNSRGYDVGSNGNVEMSGDVRTRGNVSPERSLNANGNLRGSNSSPGNLGRNDGAGQRTYSPTTRVSGGNVRTDANPNAKGSHSTGTQTTRTNDKKAVPVPKIPKIALPHQ